MASKSDSNYNAVMRMRRPHPATGRPPILNDIVSDLPHDDVSLERQERLVAPLLEESMDEAMVVTVTSSATAVGARERRRRDEGWNDMGLEQLDGGNVSNFLNAASTTVTLTSNNESNGNAGS